MGQIDTKEIGKLILNNFHKFEYELLETNNAIDTNKVKYRYKIIFDNEEGELTLNCNNNYINEISKITFKNLKREIGF